MSLRYGWTTCVTDRGLLVMKDGDYIFCDIMPAGDWTAGAAAL